VTQALSSGKKAISDYLARVEKMTAVERAQILWKSPVIVWNSQTAVQRQISEVSWKRGDLDYKLTPNQLRALNKIRKWIKKADLEAEGRVYALDSSRRFGKSVLLLLLAFEFAIKNPGTRTVYCAPEEKEALKILLPLHGQFIMDCPPALAPVWSKTKKRFDFTNGSWIEVVGLDMRPDGARGTHIDLCLLDEAGFYDNLEYLLNAVLYPMMLGKNHARIVCASTPSKTPGHYWSSTVVPECISAGAHDSRTLPDADQYTHAERREFIKKAGGVESSTCQREYFCMHVIDELSAIVPEFGDHKENIVREVEEPEWFDAYTVLDPGFNDLAAVVFGYWDFATRTIVVVDEFARPRANSRAVADGIKAIEKERWSSKVRRGANGSYRPQPYMRYSDNNPQLIADLHDEHGLVFHAVQKSSLDQMVNNLRVLVEEERLIIHPRCKKLIAHLDKGVWKNTTSHRKAFARPGGEFGHYDLIAALVYLVLMVQQRRNPTPAKNKIVRGDYVVRSTPVKTSRWQKNAPAYVTGRPGDGVDQAPASPYRLRTGPRRW
jgi:hypothetical protein